MSHHCAKNLRVEFCFLNGWSALVGVPGQKRNAIVAQSVLCTDVVLHSSQKQNQHLINIALHFATECVHPTPVGKAGILLSEMPATLPQHVQQLGWL